MDNSYYFIDRTGKKIMDIPSDNDYGVELQLSYIKYGIYYIYATGEAYDINLQKIENFDSYAYYRAYTEESSVRDYDEILSKFGYAIEDNVLLYNNERIMTLDYYDVIDLPDYDEIKYLIKKMNIFPIVTSDVGHAQIIDLISRQKILDIEINGYHRGYFSMGGKIIEFRQPGMFGISKIYNFFNNELIDVDPDFGKSTTEKTYYILENGGTISRDSTKYIYYNSNNEKIYETSESPY